MKTIKIQIHEDFCGTCRRLIKKGESSESTLEMYRGEMLCLSGNIGKCSQLQLNGSEYRKYRPRISNKDARKGQEEARTAI